MMAKFNNLRELKQEVRLHIVQLNTQLFEQYQTVDHILNNNIDIANEFAQKKKQLLNNVESIRTYESQKQSIFENIYKQYGHLK